MKLSYDFPKLTLFNHRKLLFVTLLGIFLIYCTYTSSTCLSKQLDRGRNLIGQLFVAVPSNHHPSTTNQVDEPQNHPRPQQLPRTRTCANELNQYSSVQAEPHSTSSNRRRLPSALIIGVKKSGTRALLEFVRLHPDVRASGCEVHFFDRHYNKGLNWYRHRMPPTTRDTQLTMEKTPSYFITREVPKRVFNMAPKTKLLLVVRDPVTRAVSDYTQAITKLTTNRPFEELAFVNGSRGVVNTKWGPLRIGLYSRHLHRWLHYFPLSQFLFISGERLIADPAYELSRVEEFLNLRPVITENDFYLNTTKGFPCILRRGQPHCLGKTKGRSHPAIDSGTLNRLRQFYRPFNRKFYEMTGMDFGWA